MIHKEKPERSPHQIITVNLPLWMIEVVNWFVESQLFLTRSELVRQMIILGLHEYLKDYRRWLVTSPIEAVKFEDTKKFLLEIREKLPTKAAVIDAKYIRENWEDVWQKLEAWFK